MFHLCSCLSNFFSLVERAEREGGEGGRYIEVGNIFPMLITKG